MENYGRYRQYAADCINIAQQLADPSAKSSLLDMAMVWINLAEQSEKIAVLPAQQPDGTDRG